MGVFITRKKKSESKIKIEFEGRSYRAYNPTLFQARLLSENWVSFDQEKNADTCWDIMYSKILKHIDFMCPIRKFRVTEERDPWMSDALLELIRDKDEALRRANVSKDPEDRQIAKRLRNYTTRRITKARADFIKTKLDLYKGDSQKFWKTIQEVIGNGSSGKKEKINLYDNDGKIVNDEDTAGYINEFFTSIGPNLAKDFKDRWSYDGKVCNHLMPNMSVEEQEVVKLVNNLSTHKSSSVKNVSSRVLKDAFQALSDKVTYMFNVALSTGNFPRLWKRAKVVPLPKEGDRRDVNNLRPVSLLPLPGKLLEKVIHTRISQHLGQYNLLSENQGGFREKNSTINIIANMTDNIFSAINRKQLTIATFIDFKKAFDTVDNEILLKKLQLIGIKGLPLKILDSYMTDRQQQTLANGLLSKPQQLKCGVPQGSILGPLLFLVYINDLDQLKLHAKISLYADDTVLYISGASPQDLIQKLQEDLNKVENWCKRNRLTINAKKTKVVILGTSKQMCKYKPRPLILNNEPLQYVDSYKYLGVTLDNHLTYNTHLNNTIKITAYKLHQLGMIRRYITEGAALQIYKTMVLPYLDYGDIFIIGANKSKLAKMQRLQNRGLKMCLSAGYRTSTNEIHHRVKLPLLEDRRTTHLRNFMFRRSRIPKYLDISRRPTRQRDAPTCKIEKSSNVTYGRSVLHKGAVEWNSLEVNVRNIDSYVQFKKEQKRWLRTKIPNI